MVEVRLNPYNVGGIAGDANGEGFFGRTDILDFVRDRLASKTRAPILLQGQRRIGKSSVLRQIPRVLGSDVRCAVLDLQGKARLPLADLLYAVARGVALACGLERPDPDAIDEATFDAWLVQAAAPVGGLRQLVLLFDEFDVVDVAEPGSEGGRFVPWLSDFTERSSDVGCVMVVGRKASELSDETTGRLLRNAVHRRIGRLTREDTLALVTGLADGALDFSADALSAIWHHAAGHPYCTQVLCSELWNMTARSATAWPVPVGQAQVEAAVVPAIDSGTLGLNWIYDGLTVPSHRFFLGAMAELASARPEQPLTMDEIERELFKRGISFDSDVLRQTPVKLADWDVIDSSERGYTFSVPMIGQWISRNRPLSGLSSQTQLVNPRAFRYYEMATENVQKGAWDEAISDYRLALQANPALVEAHLGVAAALRARNAPGDLSAAIEAYERALELDPATPKTAMLDTLVEGIETNGANVADQVRLYERIVSLDDVDGPFAERAKRLLLRFAELRNQTIDTIDGAAELFAAAGAESQAAAARARAQRKQNFLGAYSISLLGGIGLAFVPFDKLSAAIGRGLDAAASDWLRATLLSLGIGLGVAFLSRSEERSLPRSVTLLVAGLATGLVAQYLAGNLVVAGFVAGLVAFILFGAIGSSSTPVPEELRSKGKDSERPLATTAQRLANLLTGYAQAGRRPGKQEEKVHE